MDCFKEAHPEIQIELYLYYFPELGAEENPSENIKDAPEGSDPGLKYEYLGQAIKFECEQTGHIKNMILINASLAYDMMTEVLCHELAHIAVGKEPPPHDTEHSHGPLWKAKFDQLFELYNQRLCNIPCPPGWKELENGFIAKDDEDSIGEYSPLKETETEAEIEIEEYEFCKCDLIGRMTLIADNGLEFCLKCGKYLEED